MITVMITYSFTDYCNELSWKNCFVSKISKFTNKEKKAEMCRSVRLTSSWQITLLHVVDHGSYIVISKVAKKNSES